MGTEIGVRDLGDEDCYNQLPVIANRLGLDMTVETSLWKDHALLILNDAVLWSFNEDGIRIVGPHTASKEFSTFCNNEEKKYAFQTLTDHGLCLQCLHLQCLRSIDITS
jgi:nitric-oxide synthase